MKSYEEYLQDARKMFPSNETPSDDVIKKVADELVLRDVRQGNTEKKSTKKFCVTLTVEADSGEELLKTPIIVKMLNGKEYVL